MAHETLLDISARMVGAAREGDWDMVATWEAERGALLASVSITDPASLPVLKTLLAHTEEVRQLAGQQREHLNEALGQHQHRHRAVSAYLHAGHD
jgi:flagellar protein FliT